MPDILIATAPPGADAPIDVLDSAQPVVFDETRRGRRYVLVGPNGRHLLLSTSAYNLLCAVKSGQTFEAIASAAPRRADGSSVTPDQLEQFYKEVAESLQGSGPQPAQRRLPGGFWFRLPLVRAPWVSAIARRLCWLYQPSTAAFALLIMIAAAWGARHVEMSLHSSSESAMLVGYALFLLSLLAHEFGHASACVRFGVQPSEIGATLYLIYPALYSDVTAAWRLRRWQRVIVDLGGNYFQGLVAAAFVAAFAFSHWEPLRVATVLIVYTALFSLNPVFKFDGYWVVADACGVLNLSQQPARIVRHVFDRVRGRRPIPLEWPASVTVFLVIYSVLTIRVWSTFIVRVGPAIVTRVATYYERSLMLVTGIVHGDSVGPALKAWLTSTLLLVAALAMCWRLARLIVSGARWVSQHVTVRAAASRAMDDAGIVEERR